MNDRQMREFPHSAFTIHDTVERQPITIREGEIPWSGYPEIRDGFAWFPVQPGTLHSSWVLPEGVPLKAGQNYTIGYQWDYENGPFPRLVKVGFKPIPDEYRKLERPSFDEVWLTVATMIAKRGTCPRRQVGAVITTQDNVVVSTGYNGAPRGMPHCTEVGCLLDDTGRCKRTSHAEMNAILQAAGRQGYNLYCTDFPCSECANMIIQAGIRRVVYIREYESQPELQGSVSRQFKAAGVKFVKASEISKGDFYAAE